MQRPISEKLAEDIFKVLVNTCECHEMVREQFMNWALGDGPGNEFRFGGIFGMAGKIWLEFDRIRVSGPNHSELKDEYSSKDSKKLKLAVVEANKQLAIFEDIDPLIEVPGDPLFPT